MTRSVAVAGWTISLLELDALHAPLRWVFPDAGEDEIAWLPCHALLCRRGAEVMLVDTGLGVFHDVFDLEVRLVSLDDGLAVAGCSPDEVTTVVLTHFDADHAGGILVGTYPDDLAPALPSARVAFLETNADLGEDANRIVTTLEGGAGVRIDRVASGEEIVPGVRLRSAPGHRAGHACLDFTDGTERFVFLADVVHAREHVAHPEWDFLHDSDPEVGLATRRAFLRELESSGATVACSHVEGFGLIGRGPAWIDIG